MSKVLKMVLAKQTNIRGAEVIPNISFESVSSTIPNYGADITYAYDCKLTLGAQIFSYGGEDLSRKLDYLRIQLAHELYGEFKDTIVGIYNALQQRDIPKALALNDKLYREMFVDV